ncbi:MAG: zf-HC2 domain-containing protein [Gemmatimonadales bacterium]
MSHLDEGTLHALLDGELDIAEVREIQTHLGTCAACDSRLQDVKQFLAEADRLVGALETPSGSARPRYEPAPPPDSRVTPPQRELPPWEPAPELLLPDSVEKLERRRWARTFRWAAMILVIFGAGRVIRGALRPGKPTLELTSRDAAPAAAPAVVSPEEVGRPEPTPAREYRPAPVNRTKSEKLAPQAKALANRAVPAAVAAVDETVSTALEAKDSGTVPQDSEALAAVGLADTNAEQPSENQDVATRQAAAAALEELDRERIRSRAAAATAALPPARTEGPLAAEPAPRTLEQRAQVYLRIGLDEAASQLGRPVHVIEAMTPEFLGLTPGRLVPGADPNRPVVRVVYLDRGRMVLLDQQRMRTGQAPGAAAGNLRWAQGDVLLYLHGEPGPDVLRNLQRRVR